MKVSSEKTGPCEFTLTIEVENSRRDKALHKTGRELTRRAPIPGFRPGKAPYQIIENYFGKDVLYGRALESVGQEIYEEALKEAELEPYAQGNLDIGEYDPLTLTAVVPVMPVIKLGDYRSITMEKPDLEFDEAEIDNTLQQLREQHANWVGVERAAADGDQVIIDLTGTVGDEEVMSQSSRKTQIGENMYPEGLFEHIVGLAPEQSVDYEKTYDEDEMNTRLAGKTVSFHVEVLGVNEKQLPELDDDFASQVGGEYESLDALRQGIRDSLYTSQEDEAREQLASDILLEILQDAEIEYPAVAVEREIDLQLYELQQRVQGQGFAWETFVNMQGKSEDEMRDDMRASAEQNLKETLVLQQISMDESLAIEPGDVDAEIDKMLEQYGPQAEMMRPLYDNEGTRMSIGRRLLLNKTLSWLIDMATGELPEEPEAKEGEAADEGAEAEPLEAEAAEEETVAEATDAGDSAEDEEEDASEADEE